MALLEVHDVVAGYVEGIDVLTGVSVAVERGSITGIIGANGAGKSTLLKTIFGFLHPRRGRIVLDGHEIQALPPHAVKRQGVSYVAQGASVFPQLTVQENLDLGAWVFRADRARMAAMLERAWAAFPRLREKRRSRATTLSGGEAKMLSLAKELVTDPSLLLVDEPSAGLSPKITEQVYTRLLQARDAGATILLVDQNIAKAIQVSDYLYMIEMGRVLHAKVPIVVGVAAGGALAALLGWGLGTLCLRMRAIYLALATWAFAESVRLFVAVEYQITRGDLGLMTPFFFGTPRPTPHYYVFLALALGAILAAWQLVHSRVGVYLRAIRDDEEA